MAAISSQHRLAASSHPVDKSTDPVMGDGLLLLCQGDAQLMFWCYRLFLLSRTMFPEKNDMLCTKSVYQYAVL